MISFRSLMSDKYKNLSEALLCSVALMIFSFYISFEFPLKLVSFSALISAAYLLSRNLKKIPYFFLRKEESGQFIIYILLATSGIVSGILLGMFYRWYLGISLMPGSIHLFAVVAALIGAVEELVFRGFIQEQVKEFNGPFSVLFSTLSHTGYKCCLFIASASHSGIDVYNLAFWTFLFGLMFGTVRHLTKSIIPSLVAHAVFDIVVYAGFAEAPWWVW
jgi:membrane protease YdiL (CAAX protease family)